MTKVYLETSFFSACVSKRTSDKIVGWRASSLEWWNTQASRFELYISAEVIRELTSPDFPESKEALDYLKGLNVLQTRPEVLELAKELVGERIMPAPSVEGDAVHVAHTLFYEIGYLLTWNVKHLAPQQARTPSCILQTARSYRSCACDAGPTSRR
jgi:hypothetical protein